MPTVLIVDDDARLLKILAVWTEAAGHAAATATSGTDALRVAAQTRPASAWIDLRMPGLDGIDTYVETKRAVPSLCGGLMTGFTPTDAEWDRAFRAGFVGFLRKPFRRESFLDSVARLSGRYAVERVAIPAALELRGAIGSAWEPIRAEIPAGHLHRLVASLAPTRGPNPEDVELTSLGLLALRILLATDVTVPLFWVAAASFKGFVTAPDRWTPLAERFVMDLTSAIQWNTPSDSRVVLAISLLENAPAHGSRTDASDVAEILGIHESSMGRLLQHETGLGFREWRTAALMRRAVCDLEQTDLLIKEIAARAGFTGVHGPLAASFDRAFESVFGVSPGRFRNFCRNRQSSAG